jgi:multidrug efflux pump subunit AcrA (membrane-fusion protein)
MRTYLVFIGVLMLLCGAMGCGRQESTEAKPVVEVTTAAAEERDWQASVSGPALLHPRQQASISARIAAPIQELRVTKGDAVRKGQVLAVLVNRDLENARNEAKLAAEQAQTEFEKLSGSTLPGDLQRSQAQVAATQAALNTAQKIYDRREALLKEGAIPQREVLVSQAELASAKSNFDVARKSLELLQKQSSERDLALARNRVEQARARLEQAEAQLAFTVLTSPFDGVVTDQFLYPGDLAKPEAPVFVVMDIGTSIARAQIPASAANDLQAGQKAQFIGKDTGPAAVWGTVKMVNQAIDRASRTLEVWAEFTSPGKQLRPGAFGTLEIFTGKAAKRVVVPAGAVMFEEGARKGTAMVVDAHNMAHARKVQAGMTRDGWLEITQGIKAGEQVVVEGVYGLPDNTEVKRK